MLRCAQMKPILPSLVLPLENSLPAMVRTSWLLPFTQNFTHDVILVWSSIIAQRGYSICCCMYPGQDFEKVCHRSGVQIAPVIPPAPKVILSPVVETRSRARHLVSPVRQVSKYTCMFVFRRCRRAPRVGSLRDELLFLEAITSCSRSLSKPISTRCRHDFGGMKGQERSTHSGHCAQSRPAIVTRLHSSETHPSKCIGPIVHTSLLHRMSLPLS